MPVPGDNGDEDLDMTHDPDEDGGHPPGGGPQGPGPGYGPSPDEPALPMEYHEESPPPGGPPDAPGAPPQYANPDQVLSPPIAVAGTTFTDCSCSYSSSSSFPGSSQFSTAIAKECVTDSCSWSAPGWYVQGESRGQSWGPPVVLLPGQSAGKKDPPSTGDFPGFDEPASSSSAPAPAPGFACH